MQSRLNKEVRPGRKTTGSGGPRNLRPLSLGRSCKGDGSVTALEEEKIMDREQDDGGFLGSTFLRDDTVEVLAIGMSGWRGRCRGKNEGLRRI